MQFVFFMLLVHGFTGFGSKSEDDMIWSVLGQRWDCKQEYEHNVAGKCESKCENNRLWISEGKCLACDLSWQHVESGNVCTPRCDND